MRAIGVLAALTLVAAACGGDDDAASPDTAAPSTASTAPTAPTGPSESTAATAPASATSTPVTAPTNAPTTTRGVATTAGEAEGPVEFVDDRGETITFETPPRRVVAWQAQVPALVELGIEPVGVLAFNPIETNPAFIEAGVDTDSLVAVSQSYGDVDIEQLAALDPDVILTYTFGDDILQGFEDAATQDLAAQVAPIVALDSGADVMTGIARMEEFAELLGADLDSPDNTAAVAEFDQAVADLQRVIDNKPGLTVAFGGGSPDNGLFIAPIASYPELQFYESLGLDVLDGPQDSVVSWELVENVAADVFLIDDRGTQADLDAIDDIATWNIIPAIEAGQYSLTWRFLLSYSRADYARTIARMLPTLEAADPDVV